jgi:hypothetical protein
MGGDKIIPMNKEPVMKQSILYPAVNKSSERSQRSVNEEPHQIKHQGITKGKGPILNE